MQQRGYGPWVVVTGGPGGVGAEFAQPLAESRVNLLPVARAPIDETVAGCRRHSLEVRAVGLDLTATDADNQISSATTGFEVDLKVHNGASTCGEELVNARPRSVAGDHRPQYLRHARPRPPLRQRPRRVVSHGLWRAQGVKPDLRGEPPAAGVHGRYEWSRQRRAPGALMTTTGELASVALLQQRDSRS
jgi:NAD(P)-dependent dehydrogenase (short-subunit alcohol dehydrogenase family)